MTQPEAPQKPNPERRSDAALLCLCIGFALLGVGWVLGVGGALATVLSGGSPAAVAGGIGAFFGLILAFVAGFLLSAVGAIWLIVQVIADQTGSKERYSRDVER